MPGRGRNFRKMSDARESSFLLSLASPSPPFTATRRGTTRHDVTRCFTSAYETRKDDAHARADTQDAQRIFAGRRRVLLSRANCPSSAIPYILPSSRLLATPLRPLSTRRTASPFYPLSFILYPLYPGLPRQADASAPNGIMHRELVSYRLAVCLIFPIGPELRHAWFPLPPPCVRVHHVCMYVSVPFSPSPLPSFTPLSARQSRFLPLFLSLRAVLRAPIKESRPTPVCAPDTIASLFPSSRSLEPLLFLSLRRRLVPPLPTLHPICFLKRRPWPPRTAAVASRCISPRNCILHTRPRGRMEESLRSLGGPSV